MVILAQVCSLLGQELFSDAGISSWTPTTGSTWISLQWLRRSLVISSTWRVAPHCMDPEGTLDWWVKTEQGEMGQLLPLLETCSHQTAVLKLAGGGKCPFYFFFPILLIIEWWGGLGEFKKKNPQARCCQKRKAKGKKGTGYLGDVGKKKKKRRVFFYVSWRQVENLNGVDWNFKKNAQ